MLNKIYILSFLILVTTPLLFAQQIKNLVPNGGFTVNSCFYPIDNLWQVNGWNACVQNEYSSSDYFDSCQLQLFASALEFIDAELLTHKYDGVSGIQLRTRHSFYREYLQTKLNINLTIDTTYIVELNVHPVYAYGQLGLFVNRLEILFTTYEQTAPIEQGFIPGRIDTTPTLVYQGAFLNDTTNWTTLKLTYKAKGGEEWLVIGNFSHDSLIGTQRVNDGYQGTYKSAYYLIDDVMVYKASDTIVRNKPEPILPNVFSPNQDGVNEFYAIENLPENSTLEVFNRWGSLVFKQAPYLNNWPGKGPNGNPLADGVYFAILTYTDQTGKLQQKKQAVHVVR